MSEDNVLNLEEEPSGTSQPVALPVDELMIREPWEQELRDGSLRLFKEALSPVRSGLENLQESIQGMASVLSQFTGESQLEADLDKVVTSARTFFLESSRKTSEHYHQQMEAAREEWAVELGRRLEETRDEIRRESARQIDELETQLRAGREALELVIRTTKPPEKDLRPLANDRSLDLKRAIDEINVPRTQVDTLAVLMQHAGGFAPRVLFFVVRAGIANGWKAGGFTNGLDDELVKTLSIPVDDSSLIGRALLSFNTERGEESGRVLGRFAEPSSSAALAIPLVVRGRSAAVLYADAGTGSGDEIDSTALEIIMRVAAMAIELLPTRRGEPAPAVAVNPNVRGTTPLPRSVPPAPVNEQPSPATPPVAGVSGLSTGSPGERPVGRPPGEETRELHSFSVEVPETTADTEPSGNLPSPPPFTTAEETSIGKEPEPNEQIHPGRRNYEQFRLTDPAAVDQSLDTPQPTSDLDWVTAKRSTQIDELSPPERVTKPVPGFEVADRPSSDPAPPPLATAQSTESEQRAHNDARRFARLLVSEIKLYNGVKVGEGRRNYDLYARLAEEINRSRKVYEKRVSPAVAARFDYFYDELVQTLADGDKEKLGVDCPGPQLR